MGEKESKWLRPHALIVKKSIATDSRKNNSIFAAAISAA